MPQTRYQSSHTGAQIDEAIEKALDAENIYATKDELENVANNNNFKVQLNIWEENDTWEDVE